MVATKRKDQVMRGLIAGKDDSERDLIALRVAPVFPERSKSNHRWSRDAGWLVRQGAQVAAIGVTIGSLCSDGSQARVGGIQSKMLPASTGKNASWEIVAPELAHERIALYGLADELAKLSNPLVVTCGGRGQDLPFLRYRCIAQLIPLGVLHLSLNNRWKYFDRFDSGWHVDLGDSLAGYGASSDLALDDLTCLCGMDYRQGVLEESNAIFGVFLRFLCTTGRMDRTDYELVIDELAAAVESSCAKASRSPEMAGLETGGAE